MDKKKQTEKEVNEAEEKNSCRGGSRDAGER